MHFEILLQTIFIWDIHVNFLSIVTPRKLASKTSDKGWLPLRILLSSCVLLLEIIIYLVLAVLKDYLLHQNHEGNL